MKTADTESFLIIFECQYFKSLKIGLLSSFKACYISNKRNLILKAFGIWAVIRIIYDFLYCLEFL